MKNKESIKKLNLRVPELRENINEINFCNHCQKKLNWQEFIAEEHQKSYKEFYKKE